MSARFRLLSATFLAIPLIATIAAAQLPSTDVLTGDSSGTAGTAKTTESAPAPVPSETPATPVVKEKNRSWWGWGPEPASEVPAEPFMLRPVVIPRAAIAQEKPPEPAPIVEAKPEEKPAALPEPAPIVEAKPELVPEPKAEIIAEPKPERIEAPKEEIVKELPKLEELKTEEPKAEVARPAVIMASPPDRITTAIAPASGDAFVDALVATYKENPRIEAERQRQKATDESVAQAVSGFRPNVSASYGRGRQRTSFDGGDWNHSDTEDKGLSVEQPLFRGFGTISEFKSAKQRVLAGAYQLSAVEQQVMLQGIAAYMDVVANTSILELARNNRDVLSKQLEASNERFGVGEVTRTDVAQSEARLSQAKTQVIASEGRLISGIAEFERVVGYKPEGTLTPPENIPSLPSTLKEALEQAAAANPQLLSAVHSAKSSDYDVRTNQSVLLPRVALVGNMSRQEGAGVLGSSQFDQDSVTLQVSVPLYQSGAEYSKVRQAKNVARQRKEESHDARRTADEDVTHAWEQLETAIDTIRTREDQITAAEIALEGVKQEQEYGARTILDVLDAEQELFNARTNLVAAQRDRVIAAYSLLLTLGRLTPKNLSLPIKDYDPVEHYNDVWWLPIGF